LHRLESPILLLISRHDGAQLGSSFTERPDQFRWAQTVSLSGGYPCVLTICHPYSVRPSASTASAASLRHPRLRNPSPTRPTTPKSSARIPTASRSRSPVSVRAISTSPSRTTP